MSRYVKVSTISFGGCFSKSREKDVDIVDYVIKHLESNINQVICEKPDLIVLPEVCDRPADLSVVEQKAYYVQRGNRVLEYLRAKAKNLGCYITYPTCIEIDGVMRNCCQMIDRKGDVIGVYSKNYPVISEYDNHKVVASKDAVVFDCDFGRISALICFDLNFDEFRLRVKELKPDMVLFTSNFLGSFLQNYFAYDTRSYLVSAMGYGNLNGGIISPVGERIAESTLYLNHVTITLNLDYEVVHLDYNVEKCKAIKEKYGDRVKIHDPGHDLGSVLITSESEDFSVKDILEEFHMDTLDEYIEKSANHRNEHCV